MVSLIQHFCVLTFINFMFRSKKTLEAKLEANKKTKTKAMKIGVSKKAKGTMKKMKTKIHKP